MMTVITETRVKAGREADWDLAYRDRAEDARIQEGWIDLHLLVPGDDPRTRVVVGTWRDRTAWEQWYHLGSVWPHDNATIAGGFRRYGRVAEAQQVAEGIFAAAERFDSYRLPELFAGLPREPGASPVQYLGANVPQAWAAAAVFRFVAILSGIHALGSQGRMYVNPDLPDWLPNLTIRNLRAGKGSADLRLEGKTMEIISNTTGFDVVEGPVPRAGRSVDPKAPSRPRRARQASSGGC